jgi:L-fuconolactonase
MIVDTHVHAWNAETPATPWRSGWREFAPRPSFGVDDLLSAMAEAGVDAAALIPPEWDLGGNELVLDAAQRHPDRLLALPALSLRDATGPEKLRGWVDRPGFGGLRQIFLKAPTYSPLTDGTADWLWRAADDLGLMMMVWMPGQLDELADIVARYPRIRLTVDHMNLGMRPSTRERELAVGALAALAQYPNLAVKVSALPTMVSEGYPFASIHPAVRSLVDAFGTARVFWGSDFTRLPCSYSEARTLMREVGLPDQGSLDDVMGRSFAQWANWPATASPRLDN